MSDKEILQTSDDVVNPEPGDTLATQLADVLASRDAARERKLSEAIAKLAEEPDPAQRERAGAITDTRPEVAQPRSVVSRHQPTDGLYQRLYRIDPQQKECRSPEMDHWNHQWLQALMAGHEARALDAREKADEAYRRQFRAANVLEGALDVSDPTAVLDGSGGDMLPQPFTQVVNIAREAAAVIRSLSTVYPMSSATLRIPTAANATSAKVAEGGTPTLGESAYASKMLKAEKLLCFMRASREFIRDSAFNAVTLFGTRAGTSMGAQEDVDFCTSNGTAPNCSEAIAGGNVDEATTTVLIYQDLSALYRAVPQAYRGPGCAWLGNGVTLGLLDVLMDGNDRPILTNPQATPTVVGNSPGNEGFVLRHPVYEAPLADGTLIFGNIRAGYAIGNRESISARMSEHSNFSTGLVEFIFESRYDAVIQDAGAMKQMSALASVA